MRQVTRLGELLIGATRYEPGLAVFLPMDEEWNADTPSVIDDVDEIEDPDGGVVSVDGRMFEYALGMDAVQSIVRNALLQSESVTPHQLLEAFLFYYDHDAFIDLAATR